MRRLCVGDIHGCYDKLVDVLNKCKFSDSDILYSVGDFTDRGTQNVKTLDFIMSLKNFKPVCGNHDWWNFSYLHPNVKFTTKIIGVAKEIETPFMSRDAWDCWYNYNGGRNTVNEEGNQSDEWKNKVYNFLKDIPYLRDLGDKIIVHSVFPPHILDKITTPIKDITMETLMSSKLMSDEVYDSYLWNRYILMGCEDLKVIGSPNYNDYNELIKKEYSNTYNGSKIYIIGHTPLDHPFYDKEMGIIGIDTGAFCKKKPHGADGCLTVIDIDTLEYWQSGKNKNFHL